MPASQRNKHLKRLKPFYLPSVTALQKRCNGLYLRRCHSSDATEPPVFPQKRLAFVRPVLQKTLAKWMLQSWAHSTRKNLSGVEKYQADRRCIVPSLDGAELRTKRKKGLCQKLVKNRGNDAGRISNHKMAVSQASVCRVSELYCREDVTACGASCSSVSARQLTVGAVSCAPLPISEAMETGNCLNSDNSFTSGCGSGGATSCALRSCIYAEGEKMVYAKGSGKPEGRSSPNCVKLCASACEEDHLNRKTRVLSSQPCQVLKVTTLQTESKKPGSQPQTFCDAFSQFLMCSNRTMDAVKRKTEKFPEEKAQSMAKVPSDCNKFSNLRANIPAKKQLDFIKGVVPELKTKISVKEPEDFRDEVPSELKTQFAVNMRLGLSNEALLDLDEKLPDIFESESSGKGRSDYNRMKGSLKKDSEQSEQLDMRNQSESDSVAIASVSCVDNSISDIKNLVNNDLNCTIQNDCKFPPIVDISTMADQSPQLLEHTGFAGNLAQYVTPHGRLILSEENLTVNCTTTSSNDLKDSGAEERFSSSIKSVTLVRGFVDTGLNSEREQQNSVGSKVMVSENLDSGISDSEHVSSRHATDSSQESLGVIDTAGVATDCVAVEITKDISIETSDWLESESSDAVAVHYNHSSHLKHSDASATDLTEEIVIEDSSDSDAGSQLRVLESHCRPVHVLLRRLTSEAIDAFCNHPQPQSVKPLQPEESPQAKTPKKKDPLLTEKPRQPKPSKSETKKRKPKPPSWSKDDLAESITLDLLNWLPDLVEEGTSVRRSSSATKRKFDGSVSDESLDESTPYIPNFMTHSNFDPPGCSLLEKWRKVCKLEQEWREESGVIPAYPSYQPTTSCTSLTLRTGDSLLSLSVPGNLSSEAQRDSLMYKSQRGALTKTPKRKSKPRKKDVTGVALDEGQSTTPRKTKARKQSKKTEVDVSDEASSDINSLLSCQNSAKLIHKVTVVGEHSHGGNIRSGNTLSDNASNENTPTGNTTSACPVTCNLQLATAADGNSPNMKYITKEPVIKSCLNGNFVAVSIPYGNMPTRNTLVGNASIASSETKNTLTGNKATGNAIVANAFRGRTTPTESTSAVSSVARDSINGNSRTKSSIKGNIIVFHSVPKKVKARVSSADELKITTESKGVSIARKTEPELSQGNNTTVDSELISKSTTDTVQFGLQKSKSHKCSVLPQLTTDKQLPRTFSINIKPSTSPIASSNFPTLRRSNSVVSSENQSRSERLQLSNTRFSSTIANRLPAVANTYGHHSQVRGKFSLIRNIKPIVASTSCHASLSASDIPATITGIVPVIGTSSSPAGVTSIASLASATSTSPLTRVSSSLASAANTGSRSILNSSKGRSASSSSSVHPSQTLSTELAAESDQSKQVNVVVTIHSLSDDLKSSSLEGTKSQHESSERNLQS